MATVLDLLEIITRLDVDKLSSSAIERTKDSMVELNVEQLSAGYDSEKKRLQRYRSKYYAQKKNAMNPEPGMWNPDLILTGAFTVSFDVKLSGDNIEFSASDPKAPELLEKYGDDVLGLSDTQQEYYNQEVFYPEFASDIEDITGLKFN